MPRPVLLFSGPWSDLPLDELAARAADWGYQGLELACWGDHLEIQRTHGEKNYCSKQLELLSGHDLQVPVISGHRVGQAVGDVIDERHRDILPEHVWGDGEPEGVRERAVEEMLATVRAAEKLGAGVVAGFTGSPIWSYIAGWPGPSSQRVSEAFRTIRRPVGSDSRPLPRCGVRFALEVHPGQIAFDLYSAEVALDALDGREEFGFLFDPSHLHWQGVDPVEFLLRFPRPDLSRAYEGRDVKSQWPHGRIEFMPAAGRPAPRLGIPLAGPWRHRLGGDHPCAESIGYDGALSVGLARPGTWIASRAPRTRANSSNGWTLLPRRGKATSFNDRSND